MKTRKNGFGAKRETTCQLPFQINWLTGSMAGALEKIGILLNELERNSSGGNQDKQNEDVESVMARLSTQVEEVRVAKEKDYWYMYLKTYARFTVCIKSPGHVFDENFLYYCMHLASKISSCGV